MQYSKEIITEMKFIKHLNNNNQCQQENYRTARLNMNQNGELNPPCRCSITRYHFVYRNADFKTFLDF